MENIFIVDIGNNQNLVNNVGNYLHSGYNTCLGDC